MTSTMTIAPTMYTILFMKCTSVWRIMLLQDARVIPDMMASQSVRRVA